MRFWQLSLRGFLYQNSFAFVFESFKNSIIPLQPHVDIKLLKKFRCPGAVFSDFALFVENRFCASLSVVQVLKSIFTIPTAISIGNPELVYSRTDIFVIKFP